jgi:hypothetical protein
MSFKIIDIWHWYFGIIFIWQHIWI